LLTGCYPQRISMLFFPDEQGKDKPGGVLFARSRYGLNPDEITIPEILKQRGFTTAMIGKWHLGDAPEFLPTKHGFDSYFGIPYSNDMNPSVLIRDDKVIEDPVQQQTLTQRYTKDAVDFIRAYADKPFFLYLAHNMPHTPIYASENFRGKSTRGLYGDVVEEIDWSVGQIIDALKVEKLEQNTLVIFTSDNGPWLIRGERGGSATPLRAGKATTYEGGMRVPGIAWWPGRVPAGKISREPVSQIDLLPTLARLAGAQAPTDRVIDGKDISSILLGDPNAKSPHDALLYYSMNTLGGVRSGKWKLKLDFLPSGEQTTALYNLEEDPGEQKDVAPDHPKVTQRLNDLAQKARQELGDRRLKIDGKFVRPVGRLDRDPKERNPVTKPAIPEPPRGQ
jgi:arylsulfatase A-like enzyme